MRVKMDKMDKMDKVLITGASGFIGSHVAQEFCENGIQIVCLARKGSNLQNLEKLPVRIEYGDVENLQGLVETFKGVSFVIHVAALARDWGEYKRFYRTNVEGTLNVLKACRRNGIRDAVITSSCSVYGEENNTKIKDESYPHNSHYTYFFDKLFPCALNHYRDTKAIGKEKAVEYAEKHGMNVTVLEPVWVYGEGEFYTGFYEYLKTAKSGMPFLPGSLKNKFHVIYVKDLARAYLKAYEKRLEGVNSIIIGNREAEFMDYIYSVFCNKAGIKKPKRLPKALVYPFSLLLESIYTLLKTKNPPVLTRGRVNMFYDNIEYSSEKAVKLLEFANKFSLEEGIERTVKWYKDKGFL
jgi:nucleoside-diphosphate-sugar epimerase